MTTPEFLEREALADAYFEAVDNARTGADRERAHQLGVKAFPSIALAHDDGSCNCPAHVELRGGYGA